VVPHTRQTIRGVDPEEVADGGLTTSVEMFVCSEKRRLGDKVNAGLLANLADRRLDQPLVVLNTPRGNLRSRLGMVSVVEDKKAIFSLDVDDNSLSQRHPLIVSPQDGIVGWASVLTPERVTVGKVGGRADFPGPIERLRGGRPTAGSSLAGELARFEAAAGQ
jgi:hypothetical protein